MVNFPPLKYLTRLSLSRNNIKKISGLEEVAGTLKELWISYNGIEKLDGLSMCTKLTTLYVGSKILLITKTTRSRLGRNSTSSGNCPILKTSS
jgi:Leucine-rich repeat (LRR) protein